MTHVSYHCFVYYRDGHVSYEDWEMRKLLRNLVAGHVTDQKTALATRSKESHWHALQLLYPVASLKLVGSYCLRSAVIAPSIPMLMLLTLVAFFAIGADIRSG